MRGSRYELRRAMIDLITTAYRVSAASGGWTHAPGF